STRWPGESRRRRSASTDRGVDQRFDRNTPSAYGPVQRNEPTGCPSHVTQIARTTAEQQAPRQASGSKLAQLYESTGAASVRLAYLLTGDRQLAEDIAQDAFVRVVGRLGHLRDPGAFDAYLRRAIVNLAKNHHRRRAIERRFLSGSRMAEDIPGHERQLVDRHAIVAALSLLAERQRAAIVLRYYED